MSERPGYVYRAFGADDELLYVGATMIPGQRFSTHQSQTAWWDEVDHITLQRFAGREHALVAESAAIDQERPKYNVFSRSGLVNPDELVRRRKEAERQRSIRVREHYFRDTFAARGTVECTHCGRKPQRLPKGKALDELVCKRCRCATLVRVADLERAA